MKEEFYHKMDIICFLTIISILTIVSVGSILVVYHSLTLKQYSIFMYIIFPFEIFLYFLKKRRNFTFQKSEILLFILVIFSTEH